MRNYRMNNERLKIQSNTLLFFFNFLKNPRRNASLIPSSSRAARSMVEGVDFSRVRVVVELGPGSGEFTKELLKHCAPNARIILIEVEDSYIAHLSERYGSRVLVEHASAHTIDEVLQRHGVKHVDLLVSGLPFLPDPERRVLKSSILRLTDKGTIFRFFTYMPPVMKRVYEGVPVTKQSFVLSNFPPLWVYGVN